MITVQISRAVRLAVEARFDALFNDALSIMCAENGVPEKLTPVINFGMVPELPANFSRGPRTLEDMLERHEPNWSALNMWTGEVQDQSTQKPRIFSGSVEVIWQFWLFVPGLKGEADLMLVNLREAVESAMVMTLYPEGIKYGGDYHSLRVGLPSILGQDQEHFGLLQELNSDASFEVDT